MFTRRITLRTAFLVSGLLVAGLTLTCLTASAAPPPKKVKREVKREPQQVSNAQLHEALSVLQATKKTLEGADHDYGGHRVAAIKAIGAAQHQLHLALGTPTKPKKTGGKPAKGVGKGGEPEPQNISNMQLADAIPILQKTKVFLEQANHDYHGHRAAAVRDVGAAVQQLKVALKFEKKK
jgi:hypothetical protein